jgi:hypothetical protein
MSAPLTASSLGPPSPFSDALGERLQITDASGRPLEALRLRRELLVDAFEQALRARIDALKSFDDPSFAHVHRVDRLASAPDDLVVLSERPDGVRLSTLLKRTERGELDITPRVAVAVLRQLVPAMMRYHRHSPGVAHGALAPERIILAPNGHLWIMDSMLGPALEPLGLSRSQWWRTYRIAVPPVAGHVRFDERTDVTQLGVIALSLLSRRCLLTEEYPDQTLPLMNEALDRWARSDRQVPPEISAWVNHALQLDPRRAFARTSDAHTALTKTSAWSISEESAARVLAAWAAGAVVAREPRGDQIRLAVRDGSAISTDAVEPLAASIAPAAPPSMRPITPPTAPAPSTARAAPSVAAPSPPPSPKPSRPAPPIVERLDELPADDPPVWQRPRWWAVAAALVLGSIGIIVVAAVSMPAGGSAIKTGTLVLDSSPSGIEVTIDGAPQGTTPLRVDLPPGSHVVELKGRGAPQPQTIEITAGEVVTRELNLRRAPTAAPPVPTVGQMTVRSSPPGARVSVDDRLRGVTPVTILSLKPGDHTVLVEYQDGRSETHTVSVRAGRTALLEVPLAPAAVPMGWVDVESPFDLELHEGEQTLGFVRTGRVPLTRGHHELVLVNATLGFQELHSIDIVAGQATALTVEAPTGTVHLNARPWAEVWIDGELLGDTPLGNLAVPIGQHEFVFRNPELGEKRYTVSVTLTAPVYLTADMKQ